MKLTPMDKAIDATFKKLLKRNVKEIREAIAPYVATAAAACVAHLIDTHPALKSARDNAEKVRRLRHVAKELRASIRLFQEGGYQAADGSVSQWIELLDLALSDKLEQKPKGGA